MIYSWQREQWQQLWNAKQINRLPHALIFSGMKGIGKTEFAENFSRALLCQHPSLTNEACEVCHSCRLAAGKSHPNLLCVMPEKENAAIKVDQIREVSEFVGQSALQGEYKIILLIKADNMNVNAANALLKTLEEPSPRSLLILVSDQLKRLPATVLSRCQRVIFSRPKHADALLWLKQKITDESIDINLALQIAGGAPFTALELLKENVIALRKEIFDTLCLLIERRADPIKAAAHLQASSTFYFLDFNISFLMDLLRLQLQASENMLTNKDYIQQLHTFSARVSSQKNISLLNEIVELRKQACIGFNFNKQLMFENVLIKWMGD